MLTMRVVQSANNTARYSVYPINIFNADGTSIFSNEITDPDTGLVSYESTQIDSFTLGGQTYGVTLDTTTGAITFDNVDVNYLTFNGANGHFIGVGEEDSTDESISFSIETTPNPFETINIDFSTITMYANSGTSNLEAVKGSTTGYNAGKQAGDMTGVSISTTGEIYGVYDNGDTMLLGQIVVATFANASGLEAIGNNLYKTTMNSGDFDGVGEEVAMSGGSFTTGVLEMSNVDLAQQFTDMITTQRGFQANSRIITTSDSLLEELINLKR
jgi:flagellar hook protein FlgE